MARKKTITRDQILNAAYELIRTEGFSKFTARNIAAKMKCSTQPIYLEFKNMDDLRNALNERIAEYLRKEVFVGNTYYNEPIVDQTLGYIEFAKREKALYRTLFIDSYERGMDMQEYTYQLFCEDIVDLPEIAELSDERKHALLGGIWTLATGIASLTVSEIIQPSNDDIASAVRIQIKTILDNDYPNLLGRLCDGKDKK